MGSNSMIHSESEEVVIYGMQTCAYRRRSHGEMSRCEGSTSLSPTVIHMTMVTLYGRRSKTAVPALRVLMIMPSGKPARTPHLIFFLR